MIYGIVELDMYRENRTQWLIITWLIFAIPSLIVAYLVVSPFPAALREARHHLGKRHLPPNYIPIINMLNATLCLVAVIAYLYVGAYPDWNNAQWINKVEYRQYLPIPSFAFVFWNSTMGDDYYRADTSRFSNTNYFYECQIANTSDPSGSRYNCTNQMKWMTVNGYPMHVFDPRGLPLSQSTFNDLLSTIWLQTWVRC